MAKISQVQTDLVTIRYRRTRAGRRIITGFCVIGSARPCQGSLIINARVGPAARCLLASGFLLISRTNNSLVYQRNRNV